MLFNAANPARKAQEHWKEVGGRKEQQDRRGKEKEQEQREERTHSQDVGVPLFSTGRIDMKRSPPQEKQVVKKVETSDKDIDDDRKYLV